MKDRLAAVPKTEVAPQVPQTKVETAPIQDVKGIEREMKRKEGRELFESLAVPEKTKDGFFQKSTRRAQMEKGDTRGAIVGALNDERHVNDERRHKFFMGAVGIGMAAIVGGEAIAGIAGALGATAFGYTGGALLGAGLVGGIGVAASVLAAGAVGWAGLKIYHGLKQRSHRKKFNKIYDTGRELSTYDAYYD